MNSTINNFQMDIFLSWSGLRSKTIAEKFNSLLKKILQKTKPFISSQDIDLGTIWQSRVNSELSINRYGLLFITPENFNSPWLHYEAGGLISDLERDKVVPILFGLRKADMSLPLSQFQSVEFNSKEMFKLFKHINFSTSAPIDENHLQELFLAFYGSFEKEVEEIIQSKNNTLEERKPEKILNDVFILLKEQQFQVVNAVRKEFAIQNIREKIISESPISFGEMMSKPQLEKLKFIVDAMTAICYSQIKIKKWIGEQPEQYQNELFNHLNIIYQGPFD